MASQIGELLSKHTNASLLTADEGADAFWQTPTSPYLPCITWFMTEEEDTGVKSPACCGASHATGTGCLDKVKHRHAVAF